MCFMHPYVHANVCVCVCVCTCVCMCGIYIVSRKAPVVFICTAACLPMHVHTLMCVSVYVCECMLNNTNIYVSVYTHVILTTYSAAAVETL